MRFGAELYNNPGDGVDLSRDNLVDRNLVRNLIFGWIDVF